MGIWQSSEPLIRKKVMERLYRSNLMELVGGNIFDSPQEDIQGDSYIVLGDTDTSEQEIGSAFRETVTMTFHVYHRNTDQPENAPQHTAELVAMLRNLLRQKAEMENFVIELARVEMAQIITDIDLLTKHGIVTISYRIRHNTTY